MRTKLSVAAAPALAIVLTACSTSTKGTSTSPQPTTPPGAPPGEVVVQLLVGGGFVPIEAMVTALPAVTVLADGTVITTGAVPTIYPGPAIQPLQAGKVGKDKVDALVEKARAANLLGPEIDYGQPPVADAPSTSVTVTAGGKTYTQSAYALGMSNAGGRLTAQQQANRKALQSFVDAVEGLSGGGTRPWTPSAVAVYVLGTYQPDRDLTQPPVAWPLARLPVRTGNRPCTLVDGSDATTLLTAIAKANSRTPWVIERTQYSVAFRPIVPGQPGCPT